MNAGWRVEVGPGKEQREMVAKKGTSPSPFFMIQKGVPLKSYSWGARGSGVARGGGNGTQPTVAAIRGRSISDVGGGRVSRTDSTQNLAYGRRLINIKRINEQGGKHQQKT